MIESAYNFHIVNGDDVLFFNAFSGDCRYLSQEAFVQVNTSLRELPETRAFKALPPNTQEWLINGKFVAESSCQEIEDVFHRQAEGAKPSDLLALTMVPTLSCNLRCHYCYQSHDPARMQSNDLVRLDTFVEHWMQEYDCRNLTVCWFGGEPLLALNVIRQATKALVKHCQHYNVNYKASMVTNGTLLTPQHVQDLLNLGVTRFQITVDGTREVHDRRRPFLSGHNSSFDLIMQNLEWMIGKATIDLRINVDQSNWRSAIELVEILESRGWLTPECRLTVYLATVERINECCDVSESNLFNPEGFADIETAFMECLLRYAPHFLVHAPAPRTNPCAATTDWSFVVMPDLELRKCWSHVGAVLGKDGLIAMPVINKDNDKACVSCSILPICMGGCSYYRKIHGRTQPRCDTLKYNLLRRLQFVLRARKKVMLLERATRMCESLGLSGAERTTLFTKVMECS